jgi:ABC-2 type transport system ATP-binding protein
VITVSNLSKNFASVKAVDDLSFSVSKGGIFGIVGPDGAGKSTLLRIMSGILTPDKGSVNIQGMDVYRNTYRIKENLAYMPQRFGLYEDLTVEENIFFFGRLFGVSGREIRSRLPELYGFSRLGPFSDRLAGNLSGGMKQKLGLACCLIHSPELILLDEPTNGVDPVSRREFWKILYALLARGVTIVVSTAYLDEAERCNRVAMMYEGKFIIEGTPSDIKKSIDAILIEIQLDDVWKGETALRNSDRYSHVIREGSALRLFVRDVKKGRAEVKSFLNSKGVEVISINEKIPTLENCFMEIISAGSLT